jgi:Spy/CpxP family protein refolding chaperone
MVNRKNTLLAVLVTALVLLAPLAVFADGGEDFSPADTMPDQAGLDAQMQQKLELLPITAEQSDKWEAAFESQMMLLQQQLSPEELASLDIDTLGSKLDVNAIQAEAGVFMAKDEMAAKEGVAGNGWFFSSKKKSHVNLGAARHGDFLLGHKWAPWGYWSHAAMWDAYGGSNKTLHARGYGWGVRHDDSNWFRTHYSRVAVLGVHTSASTRTSAAGYARAQLGEPYTLTTSKTNQSKWYCSKLVWASYYWRSGHSINLDPNGGFWVTPDNLWYTGWTYVRAIG